MIPRTSDDANRAIIMASDLATGQQTSEITPIHLLIGLVSPHNPTNSAKRVLEQLGADPEELYHKLMGRLTQGNVEPSGRVPLSQCSRHVLELAIKEAQSHGLEAISSWHLLYGIVREGTTGAAQALLQVGANLDTVRRVAEAAQPA